MTVPKDNIDPGIRMHQSNLLDPRTTIGPRKQDDSLYNGPMKLTQLDKNAMLVELVEALDARSKELGDRARKTAAGATHEESRPENDKDTRAIEASYLARGQAERVAAARAEVQLLQSLRCRQFSDEQPISATALVRIEADDGLQRLLFLLPGAGGERLETAAGTIQIVTPSSPLGRGLLSRTVDDDFVVVLAGRKQVWTILETA